MNDGVLTRLIVYFVPLSLLSVGGGQSVITDIHRQVVTDYGWLTDAEFLDLFALSRVTPGPGSMIVAMIGWKVGSWAGAIVAATSIFIPSSILVYCLAHLWSRHRGAQWQIAVELGLAPVAAGMVLATAFTLLTAAKGGALAWSVATGTAVVLMLTRSNPLILMALGAAVFLVAWH